MHKQPDDMVEQLKEIFNISIPSSDEGSSRRRHAFEVFEKMGIPTRKEEEYKYTDLSKVFKKLKLEQSAPQKDITVTPVPGISEANVLVFVNGVYAENLSDIKDPGLKVSRVSEEYPAAKQHFGQYARVELDPMLALNTAMLQEATCIELPSNTRLTLPVVIHHQAEGTELSYNRLLVVAGKGSEATFIESHSSSGSNYLMNNVVEAYVPGNAHLQWIKIQNDSEDANLVDNYFLHQESDSTSTLTTITLNGAVIRNNVNITVDGQNAEANLFGLYLVDGKSHVDNHTAVDHRQPHSVSNELYKGILDDSARGVFNGKVYVRQDAQKTNAFQSNKNILVSDFAVVNTKPQLEIWADDVKCSHGCTTGQLDQEALFYLRSRGLSRKSARSLLLHAFALEGIEHLHGTPIGSALEKLIADKLKYQAL